MRIEYVPLNNITGVSSTGFYNVVRASDIDIGLSSGTTDVFLQNKVDFKDYGPIEGKKIKMFFRTGRMFRKRNENWLPTGTYYSDASTLLRQYTGGYVSGNETGRIHVTWYVQFKDYIYS